MATTQKRTKPRKRGAAARANADLDAHIQSLGLDSIQAYKSWCRQHGFTGALNKSWQERRAERARLAKDREADKATAAALAHVEQLGLKTVEEYRDWCVQHGLSEGLHKSAAQRRKELHQSLAHDAALSRSRKRGRRLADLLDSICAGTLPEDELDTEILRLVHRAFSSLPSEARPQLRDLLLVVEKRAPALLDARPALSRLGHVAGNTYLEAVTNLGLHADRWRQPPIHWRPDSRNARRQFASLARFLLADYEAPSCLDTGFFRGCDQAARRQQSWFIHVGQGQNIRTADLPLTFSKRMAHLFSQAPSNLTVEEGLRWTQVIGLGGGEELAEAILETELGHSFADEEFWNTVVLFLAENPMLDPGVVGPLVDYITYQKFTPREVALPGGSIGHADPPQPNYVMRNRSPIKLLRQMEEWHAQLQRENRQPGGSWEHSNIADFSWADEELGLRWTIDELTSKKELDIEGRAMSHCVASYTTNCRRGSKSVWSMQASDDEGRSARVLTIAVKNGNRTIIEARGKHNAEPRLSGKNPKKKQLDRPQRELLARSRRVLHEWTEREGLVRRIRVHLAGAGSGLPVVRVSFDLLLPIQGGDTETHPRSGPAGDIAVGALWGRCNGATGGGV